MNIRYFAFGSNMSVRRLQLRVPTANVLGSCSLLQHQLRFHKRGQDGSAKCDAFYTGLDMDVVFGVLFTIDPPEKMVLDRIEGLGRGYEEKQVFLQDGQGRAVDALCYYATDIDPLLQPFHWYRQHVLMGAIEAGLPADYIGRIQRRPVIEDPDHQRAERESALYRAIQNNKKP